MDRDNGARYDPAMIQLPACVYIMASQRNGTIYTGSTVELPRRVFEHRSSVAPGFTKQYWCTLLVWYEVHPDITSARHRERQIKEWRRAWKGELIETLNPRWVDLSEQIAN